MIQIIVISKHNIHDRNTHTSSRKRTYIQGRTQHFIKGVTAARLYYIKRVKRHRRAKYEREGDPLAFGQIYEQLSGGGGGGGPLRLANLRSYMRTLDTWFEVRNNTKTIYPIGRILSPVSGKWDFKISKTHL